MSVLSGAGEGKDEVCLRVRGEDAPCPSLLSVRGGISGEGRHTTLFCSDHQRLYSLAPAEAAGPPLALDLNDPQAASNSQDRRTPKVHMCTLALLTCSSVSV